MSNNKLGSLKLLKQSIIIYNIFTKKMNKVINNEKLNKYISKKLNNIEADYIKLNDNSIEIGNKTEKFFINILYERDILKKIIISYERENNKEFKEVSFENNLIFLKETELINRQFEIQNSTSTKLYINKLLKSKTKKDIIKNKMNEETIINEYESYLNDEKTIAKKTNKEKGEEKISYYVSEKIGNIYFDDKNNSDEVYDEYLFMILEKNDAIKENYDYEYEKWKTHVDKIQSNHILSKKKGNN